SRIEHDRELAVMGRAVMPSRAHFVARRTRSLALGVLAALCAAAGLAACGGAGAGAGGGGGGGGGGPSGSISAWALYSDVGDLHPGAQVQMADIPVGSVASVTLAANKAKVTMTIERSARVPADVTAQLRRTSILGQKFVDLVVPPSGPGSARLRNGERIARAVAVPGIQQLASAGAQVFGAVAPSQLSALVAAGAQGFGGQSAQLRELLDGFDSTVSAYAAHTATIRSVITSIDKLSSALAPDAQANAQAISNLAQTTAILASQSNRFESLLQALDNLSVQGNSILTGYLPDVTTQLHALASVTGAIASEQQDLGLVLHWMPGMDYAVSTAQSHHFVQLVDNIIVCGIPGGGSKPTPARRCLNGTSGG
ncbi:MAG: MCE family protein, partial [Acidimicrobiales bacterium]